MTTLKQVSEAIATAVRDVGASGLDVTGYPAQGATAPFADLVLDSWTPEAFGRQGVKEYRFRLRLYVQQTARPQDAYWTLLEFMDSTGTKSIELAVWDIDEGYDIYVNDARVLGVEEVDGLGQYGAEFVIRVAKKGTD